RIAYTVSNRQGRANRSGRERRYTSTTPPRSALMGLMTEIKRLYSLNHPLSLIIRRVPHPAQCALSTLLPRLQLRVCILQESYTLHARSRIDAYLAEVAREGQSRDFAPEM